MHLFISFDKNIRHASAKFFFLILTQQNVQQNPNHTYYNCLPPNLSVSAEEIRCVFDDI